MLRAARVIAEVGGRLYKHRQVAEAVRKFVADTPTMPPSVLSLLLESLNLSEMAPVSCAVLVKGLRCASEAERLQALRCVAASCADMKRNEYVRAAMASLLQLLFTEPSPLLNPEPLFRTFAEIFRLHKLEVVVGDVAEVLCLGMRGGKSSQARAMDLVKHMGKLVGKAPCLVVGLRCFLQPGTTEREGVDALNALWHFPVSDDVMDNYSLGLRHGIERVRSTAWDHITRRSGSGDFSWSSAVLVKWACRVLFAPQFADVSAGVLAFLEAVPAWSFDSDGWPELAQCMLEFA